MFTLLSSDTTDSLHNFLRSILPSMADDWWARYVTNALTLQQQRRVEEKNITSLSGLDLAAFLRVLDQNWFEIASRTSLLREARHYVKDMQTIRNRWTHRAGEPKKPHKRFDAEG